MKEINMYNGIIGYIVNLKDIEDNKVKLIFKEYTLEEEKKNKWKLNAISCCEICGKSIYHFVVPAKVCNDCFNVLKNINIELDKNTYLENNSISFLKLNSFLKTLSIFPENYICAKTVVMSGENK